MPRSNKRRFDMNEVATNGLKGLPHLDRNQADLLIDYINHCGDQRQRTLTTGGAAMSEADWVACGMAILQAFGVWGSVPPSWLYGPLSGRTIYGDTPNLTSIFDDEAPTS